MAEICYKKSLKSLKSLKGLKDLKFEKFRVPCCTFRVVVTEVFY